MLDIDQAIAVPPIKNAAREFLDEDTLGRLPDLVRSLYRLYVTKSLSVESNSVDEEESAKLVKIALAIEGEVFYSSIDWRNPGKDVLEAYSVIARIFEYTGRIMDQLQGHATEYWLRASIAFSLAGQAANSAVAAQRCLEIKGPPEDRFDTAGILVLRFLARDMKDLHADLDKAVASLRQSAFSPDSVESTQGRLARAGALNLLVAISMVTEYLVHGDTGSLEGWKESLERAGRLLHDSGDSLLSWLSARFEVILTNALSNALWSCKDILPVDYIRAIANHPKKPIIDLWTSQAEAAREILGKGAKRHQTIRMPTSSGKTLLAEMAIVKELTANSGYAFYVATTKALVNEVTENMQDHLSSLGIEVARVPGDYEFIPNLETLLGGSAKVFVLTPEKLDLLWRIDDSRLVNARVFIFDETQLVREGGRGLRFELLISKIRSTYGDNARLILLNAVIPSSNLAEFTRWLGHDEANGLSISWKPTRNLEAFFYRAMKEDWRGVLHYFERFQIDNVLPPNQNSSTRQNAIMLTDRYQRYLGPVLIFCSSRKDAEQIASGVMELFSSDTVSNEQLHIAASKIALVLGDSFPLVRMVSRGVAYHHASLPDPVKSLLEDLARKGQLKVLACTSTLAEGVNLNVRTVIISSPFAGGQRIDGARLRNLAGRAGRALKDTEGHVVVMHGDLQQLLQDPESGHVRSRFFEYVEEIQKTPGFNRDIDVIEAELLARVYKKQLSEQRIAAQTQFLLGSTLFSHQANHKQIASANSRMIEQAQTVFKMKPERDERLRVFAATGLSLDFCRKLDEAAARFAQGSDLRFRIGNSVNWQPVCEAISVCLLNTEKLDAKAKKKILDPSKIIQSWMEGQSLLQMVSTIEKSPTKDSLTLLSNYVYGYVAEDVSWSSAAFVRLLDSHVSEGHPTQKLDREWELIPSYIRMGVSSPSALLLLTAGLGDRELANRLTRNQDLSLEANDAWIRNISWAISLDSSEYPSLEKVQSNIIHRLGPFSFLFHPTSLIEGEVNVGLDGTVTSSGTIVGLIDPPFVSILSALRKRGFTAEMRTIGHVCYLEITPSLLRSN